MAGHTIATLWFSLSLAMQFFPGSSLWLVTPLLPYRFLYLWLSAGFCQGHLFGWSYHSYLLVFFISGCQQVLFRAISLAGHTIASLWFSFSLASSRFCFSVISLAGHTIATLWFSLSLAISRFLSGSSLWLVTPLLPYGFHYIWLFVHSVYLVSS